MNLVRSRMAFAYSQIYQIACFGDFMAYVGIVFCAALQLHPDKNKHPKAEIAFKLVSEVRILLSSKSHLLKFSFWAQDDKKSMTPYSLKPSCHKYVLDNI